MKFLKEFTFFALLPLAFVLFCASICGVFFAIPPFCITLIVMGTINPFTGTAPPRSTFVDARKIVVINLDTERQKDVRQVYDSKT